MNADTIVDTTPHRAQILQSAELYDISTQSCHATRHTEAPPALIDIELNTNASLEAAGLDVTVTCQCAIRGDDQSSVADIGLTILVRYAFPADFNRAAFSIDQEGELHVLRASFPYLREGIQSLAARLGIPGIALGPIAVDIPSQSGDIDLDVDVPEE
ncbi:MULTISPECIES: hypothetical protein [Frankia]|uniref:Uncharacterized protein n=1 Tax=Frankia alni (strain DSM 45986 / CECT 9034 / ACN14a) TaxID=326424 RepID=Q0RTF8_FRAAA|nr:MULTISPECIES: hypothetical protein [Frankia]CAJ59141.1 hypothetical protein FRAAL0466 [Frankia alni ACN14a]